PCPIRPSPLTGTRFLTRLESPRAKCRLLAPRKQQAIAPPLHPRRNQHRPLLPAPRRSQTRPPPSRRVSGRASSPSLVWQPPKSPHRLPLLLKPKSLLLS